MVKARVELLKRRNGPVIGPPCTDCGHLRAGSRPTVRPAAERELRKRRSSEPPSPRSSRLRRPPGPPARRPFAFCCDDSRAERPSSSSVRDQPSSGFRHRNRVRRPHPTGGYRARRAAITGRAAFEIPDMTDYAPRRDSSRFAPFPARVCWTPGGGFAKRAALSPDGE
jgi:hypothetical protein